MHEAARQTIASGRWCSRSSALAIWAVFSFFLPWASDGSSMALFGLPLRAALAVPVALPILVLTMFWFATRQSAEDEQFPEDD